MDSFKNSEKQRKQKKQRIKLADRVLPAYTKGEEYCNTVSHAIGAVFGIVALILCLCRAQSGIGYVSAAVYGVSLILLYAASALYHGIRNEKAKKVLQVVDHCTIYLLILGTYTPITLCAVRSVSPAAALCVFLLVFVLCVTAASLTAIDLKKYQVLSMTCYIAAGWSIAFAAKAAIRALTPCGAGWLLAGGIVYTVGAILYGIGKKHRYVHFVFHLFVLAGSVFQFISVYRFAF